MTKRNYLSYVIEAREILSNIEGKKKKIGHLALEVCTIRMGGHRGSGFYTVGKFADDIGVNRKTLSAWTQMARIEKETGITIPNGKGRDTINKFREAGKISEILKDKEKSKLLLSEVLGMSEEDKFFERAFKYSSNIQHLTNSYALKEMNQENLILLKNSLEKSLKKVKEGIKNV